MGIVLDFKETGSLIRDIREFRGEVTEGLKELCGPEYRVEERDVEKNNGITFYGISIAEKDETVAPTIYMEPFFREYERGTMTVIEAENEILRCYTKQKCSMDLDITMFSDFEKVKDRLTFRLINSERNAGTLRDVPHRMYLDMALVYTVYIDDCGMMPGNVLIRDNLMNSWGVDEETLYRHASLNTPVIKKPVIKGLPEMLIEILEEKEDSREEMQNVLNSESGMSMYILTNSDRFYGDAVILYPDVLSDLREMTGSDLYLLPSSVHEFIAIPCCEGADEEGLINMVRSVNRTSVTEEDFLSDNVYIYKDGHVTICQG